MRSSSILTLLGATLAVATPLAHNRLHKKAYVTDIVTDVVYVTVTAGHEPSTTKPDTTVVVKHTVYVHPVEATHSSSSSTKVVKVKPTSSKPTSTSIPPPPPPPPTTSSTSTPPPPPPPPATTEVAPTPSPTPEPAVFVEVTTQAPATVAPAPSPVASPIVNAPAAPASDNSLASPGVDNHNSCRSSHSAQPVAWNETLAASAAQLAATCVFGHNLAIGGGGYGQNIASQGSSSSDAWTLESALENAIISEWYSEASIFADDGLYGQESPAQSGGDWTHFTQIVWKDSLEIGCAVQACPESNSIFPGMFAWYTVCNYYPQGNIVGSFAENVSPN